MIKNYHHKEWYCLITGMFQVKINIIDYSDKQRGPGRPRKRQHHSGSSNDNVKLVLNFGKKRIEA